MKNNKANQGAGVSIRVVHAAMLILGLLLILLLVFSSYKSSSVFTKLNKDTGNYIVRQKAAHDLMEASDYLTEMTQRFTLEGDTQYLDNYFEEAFGNKRREASITTMAENDAEQTLIDQIQTALDESNTLMFREYYAMKLVIEAKEIKTYPEKLRGVELKTEDINLGAEEKMDLAQRMVMGTEYYAEKEIKTYPDTLRGVELKEEDIYKSAEEKMDLAQKMVMGTEYYAKKEIIRNDLKAGLNTLDKMMAATRTETTAQLNQELATTRIFIIIIAVLLLAIIALSAFLGTVPLIKAAKCAKNGEAVPVIGAKEFRYMATSYNKLTGAKEENTEDDD